MTLKEKIGFYTRLSIERATLSRAVTVAILVGIILNLINHPAIFMRLSFEGVHPGRALLTFLVPYFVSTYSSVLSSASLKPGKASHVDATLNCRNCGRSDLHVHIGEEIEECPNCGKHTRWRISHFFSSGTSGSKTLESLALFARHNPQPLFKINAEGVIIDANPASENILGEKEIAGKKLGVFLTDVAKISFKRIIAGEEELHIATPVKERYYNFVFKGIKALNSIYVYGNDITEIKLAERKIRKQAEAIDESIRYAWYIQKTRIPDDNFVRSVFPSSFVFFRPRDVVSGDFYWVRQIGDLKIAVVADCTGHGVPGAMISMLGVTLLNEIILRDRISEPDKILNKLREHLISALTSAGDKTGLSDGMDIALAVIYPLKKKVRFAGAFNPLIICRNGENIILKGDRMPVGSYIVEKGPFTVKEETLVAGDRLYLFTDGYQDQFGKDNYIKFSSKAFRKLITDTHYMSLPETRRTFETVYDQWKQDTEQIDDVTVMCISTDHLLS